MFRSPCPIDVTKTTAVPVPDAWKDALRGPTVQVLPLVPDTRREHKPGWCTYTYEHEQAPELEVLCGGINHKTPRAGAVWRQGNLLHFGFDLSPAEMNDVGRALLVNAIAYIARFTEDRPLVRTPCVFVQGTRLFDRGVVGRRLAGSEEDLKALEYYLARDTWAGLKGKDRDQLKAWYEGARDYLRAAPDGKLAVDPEAREFGVPPAGADFLEKAVAALDAPDRAPQAARLLERYVPLGPAAGGTAGQWRAWLAENKPYLFFSDTGGYHWYLDPLAKKRKAAPAELRGPARATLPALERPPAPPTK